MAERLGMTVEELGRRLSSEEFAEWVEYDTIMDQIQADDRREAQLRAEFRGRRR